MDSGEWNMEYGFTVGEHCKMEVDVIKQAVDLIVKKRKKKAD